MKMVYKQFTSFVRHVIMVMCSKKKRILTVIKGGIIMTQNQIAYWNLQENIRANKAKEGENYRSNLAREIETNRANLAKETETNRSNVAQEQEAQRSHQENERLTQQQRDIERSRAKVQNRKDTVSTVFSGIQLVDQLLNSATKRRSDKFSQGLKVLSLLGG